MQIYSVPLSCTLKKWLRWDFVCYVCFTTIFLKIEKGKITGNPVQDERGFRTCLAHEGLRAHAVNCGGLTGVC